jgi:hypothetical protein
MAIEGLSGFGKSGLALAIAYVFAGGDWNKVYEVDTENRSADLYVETALHTGVHVDDEALNVFDLTPEDGFKPSYYHAARNKAINEGGLVMLNDSLSHCWQYKGGILDMVNEAQARDKTLNRWTAWGVPEIADEKNSIMDLVRSPRIHCISTLRTKEKMEMVDGDDGKKKLQSMGEQQIMMPDFKYEPDLVVSMVEPGNETKAPKVRIIKSRYRIFVFDEVYEMTDTLIKQMYSYLDEGTSPEELLRQQHDDYVMAVKDFLDNNPQKRNIWNMLKDQAGHKETKLGDLPLQTLKLLFGQLVS